MNPRHEADPARDPSWTIPTVKQQTDRIDVACQIPSSPPLSCWRRTTSKIGCQADKYQWGHICSSDQRNVCEGLLIKRQEEHREVALLYATSILRSTSHPVRLHTDEWNWYMVSFSRLKLDDITRFRHKRPRTKARRHQLYPMWTENVLLIIYTTTLSLTRTPDARRDDELIMEWSA